MNFLIRIPVKNSFKEIKTFYDPEQINLKESPHLEIYIFNPLIGTPPNEIDTSRFKYFILGDLITGAAEEPAPENFTPEKLKYLKGFFYVLQIDKEQRLVRIFNSVFSILPIYYYRSSDYFLVSSRMDLIKQNVTAELTINNKFLLEKILFNYPLFNDTFFEEIRLSPANTYVQIDKKIHLKKHLNITDFYTASPRPWRKSVDYLSDLFLETAASYFPEDKFFISFTGGLDSRALVAAAKKYEKDFAAFSYGTAESADTALPREISRKTGVPYIQVDLDRAYVEGHSFASALEFIEKTENGAAFSRAHYVHAAKSLAAQTRFIVTGNFGSELFRTMHNIPITGLILSRELIDIYRHKEHSGWIENLRRSPRWNYLNKDRFGPAFEQLVQEISKLKTENNRLTVNQGYYRFLFEELFRKYFGPEIFMQAYFFNNRTPFLNFGFIEELLKTELAGVYSDFFEENPIKRFKGQVLYAHMIKKSFPPLLQFATDRGYRPLDLLTVPGKLNILKVFAGKKIFAKKQPVTDPQKVNEAFLFNAASWQAGGINEEFFNREHINGKFSKKENINDLNVFSVVLSTNYYLQKIMNR